MLKHFAVFRKNAVITLSTNFFRILPFSVTTADGEVNPVGACEGVDPAWKTAPEV